MQVTKYLIIYSLAVFTTSFFIYACGLYYVNKTLPRSCYMHGTLTQEECMFEEGKTNIILKAYKG